MVRTARPAPVRIERLHPDTALLRIHAVGRRYGDTRDEIQRRLPRCVVSAEGTPNRHGSGTDSLFHMHCEGVRFVVRQAGPERRELLEASVLEGELASSSLPVGIRVGQTTARQLKERLGAPQSEQRVADGVRLTYRVPTEGAEEFINFHLVRSLLRRVEWVFYVD